jgi:response regulator RpfG family c-di-GMP phosphodiesterase
LALKILLADSDDHWLSSTKKFLTDHSYEVTTAVNGREAQLALYNNKYFAIFLNYDIKNHSALQVLKFIKTHNVEGRVFTLFNDRSLFTSGEVSEEKLLKLGPTASLFKPVDLLQIKNMLEEYKSIKDLLISFNKRESPSDVEEVSLSDAILTKVPLDEFFSAKTVLFNVFVKIDEGRYLKILHAGDPFTQERIAKYKEEKKMEFLYFHVGDRRKFIQYNNYLLKKLIKNDHIATHSKLSVLKNVCEKFVEEVFALGLKHHSIDLGKEISESVFEFIDHESEIFKLLRSYKPNHISASTQTFLVTLFSGLVIKQFEWQSKATIETTVFACLIHDIGKTLLPRELASMRSFEMSPDQYEQYKKHPELGLQVVESFREINNSVKQIILQHHEAFDGTGFPFNKKGTKILTLANIVYLADDFAHTMTDLKLTALEAMKKTITAPEGGGMKYNPATVEKLIAVFADPEKLQKEISKKTA